MSFRYTPLLRWKRGEQEALSHLSDAGKVNVAPLFILAPKQYVGKKKTRKTDAIPAPNVVVLRLLEIWGTTPFYFDASDLPSPDGTKHPITDITAQARASGLNLIPATRLNAAKAYQDAVTAITKTDPQGVGLRIGLQSMTSASKWAPNWQHQRKNTDLLIDFGNQVSTVSALGDSIDHAFLHLFEGTVWRSVTMLGTSMPENFADLTNGLHFVERSEQQLWARLTALGLPYTLHYGDYATVPFTPPPEGIKWGYPISVRYTLPTHFLICKGVRTKGPTASDMDVQLKGHAKQIVAYKQRTPLSWCWADARIDEVASGKIGPKGLEEWVKYGVNRHVELVRSRLP
jgi:hypothetical protein